MKLRLLGQEVEGRPDIGEPTVRTHWIIKLGPYEARVTQWNFYEGHSPPKLTSTNYSYTLKFGSEYILDSQSSVKDPNEAINIIDKALAKYIRDKQRVESYYEIRSVRSRLA